MADHSGHRERVKTEFLARGLDGWTDHRALELLLFYALPQKDTNNLAHDLVDRFGSLAGVLDASRDELCKVKGVSNHTAVLLKLIPALSGRYHHERGDLNTIINGPKDAIPVLSPYFYGARNEMVYILCMDGKRRLLGVRKIAEGSIHAADINIRRIVEEAVGLRAARLYLAHNHISNIPLPSAADWRTTDTIRSVLAPVGLVLEDHLIFGEDDVISLNQSEANGDRGVYELF